MKSGFTLVEALLAMAIMSIVMAILFSVSNGVLSVSSTSRGTMDAEQNIRAVMDTLDADLKDSLNQYGFTVLVTTATNSQPGLSSSNTQLTFLTHNRGPYVTGTTTYRCLAVSYWLNTTSTTANLMRSYCPIALVRHQSIANGCSHRGPSTDNGSRRCCLHYFHVKPLFTSTAGNFVSGTVVSSVLAQGILRFETIVNLDNGTIAPLPQNNFWSFFRLCRMGRNFWSESPAPG